MTDTKWTREELLAWAAGMVGANAAYIVTPEQGPTKKYLSFTMNVIVGDDEEGRRLCEVNGNGGPSAGGVGWELGGYAANRGFLAQVWKYLSPSARTTANNAIKHYKEHRDGPFK
jgi:hypothetical protein